MWDTAPSLEALEEAIADPTHPIGMRMRAAYFLRQSHANEESTQEFVVNTLAQGLLERRHGSLMRHEFAYVMGQLRDERCCKTLEQILMDDTDCTMVRHEAAEALGAIGAASSQRVLREVMEANPNTPELAETCRLALSYMKWRDGGGDPTVEPPPPACACMLSPYSSVDPAPPHPAHASLPFEDLGDILCDATQPIFERYRAMFSLRNRGGEEAVQQLCRALVTDKSSALLRHETAYVLGQMQHPSSVEALETSLRRVDEHSMVRHESAEALGAIDGRWEDVEAILQEFLTDDDIIVRESCCVALDAADYWGHNATNVEENKDEEEADHPVLSFGQQKSLTNGKQLEASPSDEIGLQTKVIISHFNVKE